LITLIIRAGENCCCATQAAGDACSGKSRSKLSFGSRKGFAGEDTDRRRFLPSSPSARGGQSRRNSTHSVGLTCRVFGTVFVTKSSERRPGSRSQKNVEASSQGSSRRMSSQHHRRSQAHTFVGDTSTAASQTRVQVNIALNEDLACSYKQSVLSTCSVEAAWFGYVDSPRYECYLTVKHAALTIILLSFQIR
jgi:hypothetical protein